MPASGMDLILRPAHALDLEQNFEPLEGGDDSAGDGAGHSSGDEGRQHGLRDDIGELAEARRVLRWAHDGLNWDVVSMIINGSF